MKKHIYGFLFLCISLFINGQNKDPEDDSVITI